MCTQSIALLVTASSRGLEGHFHSVRRCMLAEKLLSKGDYDCDREIRTLELLKLRFGEANLLNCEARPMQSAPAPSWHHSKTAPYLSVCRSPAGSCGKCSAPTQRKRTS